MTAYGDYIEGEAQAVDYYVDLIAAQAKLTVHDLMKEGKVRLVDRVKFSWQLEVDDTERVVAK